MLLVDMPLVGWNQYKTVMIPTAETAPGKEITIGTWGTSNHNDMFLQLGRPALPNGTAFLFSIKPVSQGINHFQKHTARPSDVSMVGSPGGGRAAHFCSVIDVRIKNGFLVASARTEAEFAEKASTSSNAATRIFATSDSEKL